VEGIGWGWDEAEVGVEGGGGWVFSVDEEGADADGVGGVEGGGGMRL
jgi:hypothetical protein